MYSCSNLVAISSLVLELLKKCRVWQVVGHPVLLQHYWYVTGIVRYSFSMYSGLLLKHFKWDRMLRQLTDKLDNYNSQSRVSNNHISNFYYHFK